MKPEFSLIDWIRQQQSSSAALEVGIGDDGAVILPQDSRTVVVADMLMEGTHFVFPDASPQLAGRKALAVNLSDMAAMLAIPELAFVSLALPRTNGREIGEGVMEGLQALADEYDVVVAGGDTNAWDGPLVINVTVTGQSESPVLRSTAKAGDWIFVTGQLGGSIRGHHLNFNPRVREAFEIRDAVDSIHAMIDLSDGLSSDLHHILSSSKVGAEIFAQRIPISSRVTEEAFEKSLQHALNDGEDFELLFTVSEDTGRKLLQRTFDFDLTHIGQITPRANELTIEYADGARRNLPAGGFSHPLDAP